MAEATTHKGSADNAIALMNAATEANRKDPFRTGFLIELPSHGEVMVTGDLHGHRHNLERIVQLANLPRHRERHLILQELVHELTEEDVVCRSHRLVEFAARLKATFSAQVHILMGNHEFAELLSLAIGKHGRVLNTAFDDGGLRLYGEEWPRVRDAYDRFWSSCPLAVHCENRVFISHSTPRISRIGDMSLDYLRSVSTIEALKRKSPVFDLLWGRDYREETANQFCERVDADVLVVGHTPCDDGIAVPNTRHVILDCTDHAGKYLLLPLDQTLTQEDVVACARKLYS